MERGRGSLLGDPSRVRCKILAAMEVVMLNWWTWTWWETIVVVLLFVIAFHTLLTGSLEVIEVKLMPYFALLQLAVLLVVVGVCGYLIVAVIRS